MNITNRTGSELASVGGSTAGGSNISLTMNTGYNNTIYGSYYIDVGGGVFLIDPSVWSVRTITPGNYSVGSFWENLHNRYVETDIDKHYTALFFLFFVMFLMIASFTRFTGVETTNPAITLVPVCLFIIIASVAGFFSIDFAKRAFINRYGIALVYCLITFGYVLERWRTS